MLVKSKLFAGLTPLEHSIMMALDSGETRSTGEIKETLASWGWPLTPTRLNEALDKLIARELIELAQRWDGSCCTQ